MYGGDVVLTPDNVISILATASLFLMQELIDKCAKTMMGTIDKHNAISYCNASETYGLPSVRKKVTHWLELNLIICSGEDDFSFLQNISVELMKDLITRQNLVLDGSDFDLYTLLRRWYGVVIFICLFGDNSRNHSYNVFVYVFFFFHFFAGCT